MVQKSGRSIKMDNSRSESRREKILYHAKRIFLEYGYRDTRIDEIVAAAGGSKESIYLHFGSKKGLYQTVVHDMVKAAKVEFPVTNYQSDSIRKTLMDFGSSYLDHVLSEDVIKLLRVIISHSSIDKDGAALFRRFGPEQHYAELSRYLDYVVEQKQLRITDTYLAAKQLLAMLRGDMQMKALTETDYRPTQEEIRKWIDAVVGTFIRAYS